MSKYEEQAYRVGGAKPNPNAKPNVPLLKSQLARLKHDLEQFMARKPDGSVIAPLRERIREMELTIASAEAENKRERQANRPDDDDLGIGSPRRDAVDIQPLSTKGAARPRWLNLPEKKSLPDKKSAGGGMNPPPALFFCASIGTARSLRK